MNTSTTPTLSLDRVTPNTASYDMEAAYATLAEPRSPSRMEGGKEDVRDGYGQLLRRELLGQSAGADLIGRTPNPRPLNFEDAAVLQFGQENRPPNNDLYSSLALSPVVLYNKPSILTRRPPRKIAKVPYKVLDAPQLQDDFYLNLVDWSSANTLAVGLGSAVYLWSACTSRVSRLCDLGEETVTSVSWSSRAGHLAVGNSKGEILLWDVQDDSLIRTFSGHGSRVGSLAWNGNDVLATGSRDHNILLRDPRSQSNYSDKLVGHKQEVCGLKWSFDDQLLASGGNDNKLLVWQDRRISSKFSGHQAAVKAIGWSPHQHGLLTSGGGTADRTIRFWNTLTNSAVHVVDTGSQVCNLVWSKTCAELVSTHGYSLNQIIVWKYPSMTKVATLTGHTFRVLYLAMSPDGQSIVTGAGDETLRFWSVFPRARGGADEGSVLELSGAVRIR